MREIYLVTEIKTSTIHEVECNNRIFNELEEAKKYLKSLIKLLKKIDSNESYYAGGGCINYQSINCEGDEHILTLETFCI